MDLDPAHCLLYKTGDRLLLSYHEFPVKVLRQAYEWTKEELRRMATILGLTGMLGKSMPVFFCKPFLSQTFSLTLNQMHAVVFSESVFCGEILLYPPDISFTAFYVLHFVGPLLVPRTLKVKKKKISKMSHGSSQTTVKVMHGAFRDGSTRP